jgi:UMF1 family MFS transporter
MLPAPLARLYPLRGLPNQGQIWSWISFDVANQSFTLIINTLLFSVFFQQVVVRDPAKDDQYWSMLFAGSMLLVVIASPITGAVADGKNWRKRSLIASGVVCGLFTCLLALIEPGMLWLAVLLYIPANFMFNLGENFLASFLPQVARRDDFAKVSGFSWAMAYASALLMLAATAGVMTRFKLETPDQWRPFFVAAGLWFLLFLVPTLLFLREQRTPTAADPIDAADPRNPIIVAFARLAKTLREVPRFRDLAIVLLASFFYGGGMAVVISFAAPLAEEFGFSSVQLVMFIAVITVSGIFGTMIPTIWQDRIGHKKMVLILLGLWVATTIYFAFVAWQHAQFQPSAPGAKESKLPIWIAGNLLGVGIGSLGASNRALVGFLTPPSRSAEFFGLWGLVFKLAAILTIPFGVVKDRIGTAQALVVLSLMIIVGFVLTLFVNERRGADAARE